MSILRSALLILCLVASTSVFAVTVTLQESPSYNGTQDTYAWSGEEVNHGSMQYMNTNHSTVMGFVRFKIFASEGGPVPNGATITSATLSLHKLSGPSSTYEVRRLKKDWQEMQATWTLAATGLPWQSGGAQGSDDVHNTADAQATFAANAAWADFNVTSGVQSFAFGTLNYGWRLGWVSGTTGQKPIAAKENSTQAVRPKLTITYVDSGCGSGALRPYDGAPVNGNPIAIASSGATEFDAEHFNCGGQGTAYNDSEPANNPGQTFRSSEGVEIIAAPSGLAVNQFNVDEWMTYTVSSSGGNFEFAILASASPSGGGPGSYSVEVNGTPVPGTVTVPLTSGWDDYQWVAMQTSISLPSGQSVIKLKSTGTYFRTDKLRLTASPQACNQGNSRPYSGSPVNVPATGTTLIEAEHFNCGTEGQGYHDTVAGVNPGQTFRADNEVEITAAPSGLAVNQFEVGEWLAYTINVATAGTYDIGIIASSSPSQPGGPGAYRIEIDNQDVTGTVPVTLTTDWNDYRPFMKTGVQLTAGVHVLKLVSTDSYFRVDKLQIVGEIQPTSCNNSGLSMCLMFEASGTQFQVPASNRITLESIPGETVVPWVQNKRGGGDPTPGDSADPNAADSRVGLVNFGRDGSSALRATTRGDDDCVHSGKNPCNDAGNIEWERSELQFTTAEGGSHGDEVWFAHSVMLPQGIANVPDFRMSTQTHNASLFWQFADGGGIFGLGLYNQGPDGRMVFRASQVSPSGGREYEYFVGSYGPMFGYCLDDNPQTGVWYDFVHRVVFGANDTGLHEIWMRKAGDAPKKVMRKTGISTLRNASNPAYLKLGTYHDYLPHPGASASLKQPSSVIHDRVRRSGLAGAAGADAVRMSDFPIDHSPSAPITTCTGVAP